MKNICSIILDKKFKYILIFNFLLSTQFILGYNLQKNNTLFKSSTLLDCLYIIILTLFFTTIVYLLLEIRKKFSNRKIKNKIVSKSIIHKKHILSVFAFIFIIVCWLPAFIAFYPGILNYDGPIQLKLFLQDTIIPNNPIIHTLLLSGFYTIGTNLVNSATLGIMFYVVFQMLIMALIFSYAINFIYKTTYSKSLVIFSLLFFAVFPYNQLFPLMTTKDTLFSGIILLYIINLYKVTTKDKVDIREYIIFILITALMLLFRVNAIYAFILFLPFIFLVKKNNKKVFIKILITSIISIFIYIETYSLLILFTNAKPTRQSFLLPLIPQAVARVIKTKKSELTENEKSQISLYFKDTNKIAKFYNPSISDYANYFVNQEQLNYNKLEFYKFITKLGLKYPQIFLDAYLDTIRGYWYIADTSFMKIHNDEAPNSKGCLEIDFVNLPIFGNLKQYNFLPQIRSFYTDLFCKNIYRDIPFLYIVFQPRNIFLFSNSIIFLQYL